MLDTLVSLRWQDFVDILIVSFIIYRIMLLIRGTRAVQMLAGIAVIIIVYFISGKLDILTLHWLFKTFLSSILLVIIIVFQADIRRALTQMGKTPFQKSDDVDHQDIEEIVRAATYMAKRRIGALLVIERETGLRDYIDSGFRLDARLRFELLVAIFLPSSPMHDGGVIIHQSRIHSAGCLLPLSQNTRIDKRYGTRHRAALGLSEETDAIIIVVSEETQEISLVKQGRIASLHDEKALNSALRSILRRNSSRNTGWKQWLSLQKTPGEER
ncbi:diadenylate cyclase CdaA [Desulfogranum mediterraneum]|uniref:diadenylate cyclase CdaA n=1 Tax=Desulfogranum mediterraneum TaxID=160661 RepID=UPI00041B88A7|nr:diadenylate cyclase CdaA [Desulfogranum mediterraneum]